MITVKWKGACVLGQTNTGEYEYNQFFCYSKWASVLRSERSSCQVMLIVRPNNTEVVLGEWLANWSKIKWSKQPNLSYFNQEPTVVKFSTATNLSGPNDKSSISSALCALYDGNMEESLYIGSCAIALARLSTGAFTGDKASPGELELPVCAEEAVTVTEKQPFNIFLYQAVKK